MPTIRFEELAEPSAPLSRRTVTRVSLYERRNVGTALTRGAGGHACWHTPCSMCQSGSTTGICWASSHCGLRSIPVSFPNLQELTTGMSKGVLSEQLWTQRWRWDLPLLLSMVAVLCFIGAVYTAYRRMFWAMMVFASNVLVLKLWFVDRMVRLYEDSRWTAAEAHVDK